MTATVVRTTGLGLDSESVGTGTVVVAVLCKHQPESGLKKNAVFIEYLRRGR